MKKILISTDTASDISPEIAEKYNINLIPINLTINAKEYKDRYDISPEEFYEILPTCAEIPKTAQVTVVEHMESFQKYVDDYSIIHVTISANASGTNQSAHLAANEIMDDNPDADITILDSASFSYGYGVYLIEAAKMANEGKSKEEIIAYLTECFNKCTIFFMLDTLDFLQKGGRISPKAKILANVLDINPILTIQDGLVMNKEKVRGKKKLIGKISDMVSELIDSEKPHKIAIVHSQAPETAEKLRDAIIDKTGMTEYAIETLGPTIGIHTGPGAVGVIFQGK
ncbi:MAG: DegV family protein [Clostridia bacterium]|nr:DegV family protein [Clostridia bacterium]